MDKFMARFSIALMTALLIHSPCFADLTGKLLNSFSFSTTTSTIQHLDHGDYTNTQVTSDWTSNRDISVYSIGPELIWSSKHSYVKVLGTYGWVIDGKSKVYPFNWQVEGNTAGFDVEVGAIWNVCELFNFLPCIGFQYNVYHSKIRNQEFFHRDISSYLPQNGNKSRTLLYFPYIGFEVDLSSELFCRKVQYSINYNLGYGGGHNRLHVPHTVITDLPSTSRYGSYTRYHNLVMHDLELAVTYSPADKWSLSLEFDYNVYYNTRKLPVKLQHERELVAAGQFTRTQYHRVSDLVGHEYSIIFKIAYAITGEGGTYIH